MRPGASRPDAFAAVMATGIVSVAAADHGFGFVSIPLALIAAVALPVLAVVVAATWKRESWKLTDLDTAIGLYTYVAACCVVAARFSAHHVVVLVLGGLAVQGWVSLTPFVFRGMWRVRWTGLRDRAHGAWVLLSVATAGLAIVAVAADVLFWAIICWVLALAAYLVVTALVLWRALGDPSLRRDVPADHWILMGGLAIATLAGVHLHVALLPGPIADAVRFGTVVTWVLATLWIVPLACVGWRRIRAWPAVFPVGMYSSATFAVGQETGWAGLREVSLVALVVALVLWMLTLLRFVRGSPITTH